MPPSIHIATVEQLTDMINGNSDPDEMVQLLLSDPGWAHASEEQAMTFITRLLEKLLSQGNGSS
jgi:hypothetical protein